MKRVASMTHVQAKTSRILRKNRESDTSYVKKREKKRKKKKRKKASGHHWWPSKKEKKRTTKNLGHVTLNKSERIPTACGAVSSKSWRAISLPAAGNGRKDVVFVESPRRDPTSAGEDGTAAARRQKGEGNHRRHVLVDLANGAGGSAAPTPKHKLNNSVISRETSPVRRVANRKMIEMICKQKNAIVGNRIMVSAPDSLADNRRK